jgi:hypothetical protein
VIVGANGSGKSNVLEAVAADRLSHEFLASRGIRPIAPGLLRPRFHAVEPLAPKYDKAQIAAVGPDDRLIGCDFLVDEKEGYVAVGIQRDDRFVPSDHAGLPWEEGLRRFIAARAATLPELPDFLVFSPEYAALRTFTDEGQILPLGVRGEGLFRHLLELALNHPTVITELNEHLKVLDWFDGLVMPQDLGPGEKRLGVRDRYLRADVLLDQRATNEGFLFLLFVYVLLCSPDTPSFFAIDNADASLNPKLCSRLMADIARLATLHGKQVILTTHNPALLDGLDLADDLQRLVVCERDLDGATTLRRVPAPRGGSQVRLSEAFLRGYLGGLPGAF